MDRRPMVGVILTVLLAAAVAASQPENDRYSDESFRRGLRQLGLNDLLEFYAREFPPKDPLEAAMLRRELRLNVYQDPTRSAEERMAALAEATDILRGLLRRFPEHADRFEWQLSVGRDLILKAEPYYNNILFRDGSAEDRAALADITGQALRDYDALVGDLQRSIDEIDSLPIKQFEAYANSGHIERIESVLPRARYFRMWASYYHCLTLPAGELQRRRRLDEIVSYLTRESMLVNVEHGVSHVQAQACLLAGMAYRLLQSPHRAEEYLVRARDIAASIPDFAERQNLKWVVSLATLERVKNHRDIGQYDRAVRTVQAYRNQLPADAPGMFGLQFTLALLEGSVHRAAAAALPAADVTRRDQLLLKARQPLIDLARRHPGYQTEIYTTLYDQLGDVHDPEVLDPFEKNLYLAAMLRRTNELNAAIDQARESAGGSAAELEARRRKTLETAVAVGRQLLADDSALGLEVRPEVRFNLAVCYQQQGLLVPAIEQLTLVVDEHPEFHKSAAAGEYAVHLAESLFRAGRVGARASSRKLYLAALRGLLEHFPDSPAALDRRFSYGQTLQEDRQFAEAVRQYEQLTTEHPDYLRALFQVAECHLLQLRDWQRQEVAAAVIQSQIQVALDAARRFREQCTRQGSGLLPRLQSAALLISAEAHLSGPAPDGARALEMLEQFDNQPDREPAAVGRSMRLKVIAYQQLGRLDQAAQIIPGYIDSDPTNAGVTLQGLLTTFKEEIEAATAAGRSEEVRRKAADALIVAENLNRWAHSGVSRLSASARLAFRLEYGEALLRAERPREALALFQDAVRQDAAGQPDGESRNGRAVYGLAEAYYHVQQPAQALPFFHRVFAESPEDSDLWWRAFRRELECRMLLGESPQTLIALINQKQVLFHDLGGYRRELSVLRERLTELQ